MRQAQIERKTKETSIVLSLNLDQAERGSIHTGSGFLDHMLDLFQVHGGFTLNINCNGDTHIDMHHSVEDIGICMGQALYACLPDKKGIERYGFYYITMDEALARCCLDLSNRFAFVYEAPQLKIDRLGNLETELIQHFFGSVAENARMNLHLDLLRGQNQHHCAEALFKAFARALAMAVSPSRSAQGVPSSKGVL
jgi:imidazoleglycerol-phosphate dehydratase